MLTYHFELIGTYYSSTLIRILIYLSWYIYIYEDYTTTSDNDNKVKFYIYTV